MRIIFDKGKMEAAVSIGNLSKETNHTRENGSIQVLYSKEIEQFKKLKDFCSIIGAKENEDSDGYNESHDENADSNMNKIPKYLRDLNNILNNFLNFLDLESLSFSSLSFSVWNQKSNHQILSDFECYFGIKQTYY